MKFLAPKLAALIAIFVFLASANVAASSGFPSEAQLETELRPGLTIGEVIQRFGQPGSQVTAENGSFLYRYVAPGGYLSAEKEGYVGLELHFVEGHLHDWRTFRGYPSYAPIRPPSALKWDFRIWMIAAVIVAIYGAIHKRRSVKDENQALLEAYAKRRLQTKRLPEFQFITHETAVQNVIDRLGEPSRTRDLSFDSIVGPRKAASNRASTECLLAFWSMTCPIALRQWSCLNIRANSKAKSALCFTGDHRTKMASICKSHLKSSSSSLSRDIPGSRIPAFLR